MYFKSLRNSLLVFLCFTSLVLAQKEVQKPLIQMAILLDTSGSMDGLLAQAKTQLWKIVNEFIAAKKGGVRPELQVALYEYGKQTIPSAEGYLRMIVPLSTDLDKVSEELFALKTNGGDEYCGRVIRAAAEGLAWSSSNEDLKVIFIAGNEPFTQGNVDYREACQFAIGKGIIVNTIFCGPHQEGINTQWKDGAVLSDGMYMNIDQNQQVVNINAPQDKEIVELNSHLNSTYLVFGGDSSKAKESKLRQEAQDSAASGASGESMVQRSVSKSSGYYKNTSWDLIDAINAGKKLEEVPVEELPEEMKKLSPEERQSYLDSKTKERVEIQKKIQELNESRKKYVAEEMKKVSVDGKDSLDSAMINALRQQAAKKSFSME